MTAADTPSGSSGTNLGELVAVFLRLGLTAFGGPAAHIAMMEAEFVRRRGWLTQEQFLDLLGVANLLPGPTSTELAIYLGYTRAGWVGLLAAGTCFILPAMLLVTAFAWVYVRYGSLPQVGGLLYGVKPVLIAIILAALRSLAQSKVKGRRLWIVAVLATALSLAGVGQLLILFGAGAALALAHWWRSPPRQARPLLVLLAAGVVLAGLPALMTLAAGGDAQLGLGSLFLVFLKLGSVVYGSGYVLLAFLQADLVTRLGWLTAAQLLDATAVGQVTPGPVFTTATFIGYILAGPLGALVATVAVFLPSFVLVAVTGPWLRRLRQAPMAAAFLDGLNAAALGMMAAVTWQLALAAVVDPLTAVLAVASLVAVWRWQVNATWLVLAGGAVGVARSLLG